MVFAVCFRTADGGTKTELLSASSREDVWERVRARKLNVISIAKQNGNEKKKDTICAIRICSKKRVAILACLAAISLIFLTSILLFVRKEIGSRASKQNEVLLNPRPKKARTSSTRQSPKENPKKTKQMMSKPAPGQDVNSYNNSRLQSPGEDILATQSPPQSSSPRIPERIAPKKEPLFKNGVEQLLNMATPSSPGIRIPPLPIITDESLAQSLKEALANCPQVSEDDTEETVQRKINVEEQKDEFVQLNTMHGITISEYINALREKHNEDADIISEAHRLDSETFADSHVSDEEYLKTRKKINKVLADRGLPALDEEEVQAGDNSK